MNSYRRGLRNGVLVNPKLFILEKVNLGPHTNYWSNLVKLSQTWSNVLKTCIIWYGLLQCLLPYFFPLKPNILKECCSSRLKNSFGCGILKFVTPRPFRVSYKVAASGSRVQFIFIWPIRPCLNWTSPNVKML